MSAFDRLFLRLWARKLPFFVVFFCVVLATYAILFAIDFIPEPISEDEAETEIVVEEAVSEEQVETSESAPVVVEEEPEPAAVIDPLPQKIIFDDLNNREVTVLNPTSNSIPDLDAALLNGAVRHPDSADFSDPGNIYILAHSSYLPNVFNKNFQAFNGIQELDWGDTIRLQSSDREYIYFVERVYEVIATDDTIVPETPGKANLTLSTCDSFGSKDDRFIVEAKLVEERVL